MQHLGRQHHDEDRPQRKAPALTAMTATATIATLRSDFAASTSAPPGSARSARPDRGVRKEAAHSVPAAAPPARGLSDGPSVRRGGDSPASSQVGEEIPTPDPAAAAAPRCGMFDGLRLSAGAAAGASARAGSNTFGAGRRPLPGRCL